MLALPLGIGSARLRFESTALDVWELKDIILQTGHENGDYRVEL
jgi:hypothetical protein